MILDILKFNSIRKRIIISFSVLIIIILLFQIITSYYITYLSGLFENKDKKPNNKIGIENVNERIKYYYGKEYGVNIESQRNSGTRVTIRIPLMELEGSYDEA